MSPPCRACRIWETGGTDVSRNRELVQWHRVRSEFSSSPKYPSAWRQTHPVTLHSILILSALQLTLNSFCYLRALLFFSFFCCCSYFPLTLIIQMYWGPCALPHHKGNHRTADQRSSQMSLPGRAPRRGHSSGCQAGLAASARQDGGITCSHKHRRNNSRANSEQLSGICFLSVWNFFFF